MDRNKQPSSGRKKHVTDLSMETDGREDLCLLVTVTARVGLDGDP